MIFSYANTTASSRTDYDCPNFTLYPRFDICTDYVSYKFSAHDTTSSDHQWNYYDAVHMYSSQRV